MCDQYDAITTNYEGSLSGLVLLPLLMTCLIPCLLLCLRGRTQNLISENFSDFLQQLILELTKENIIHRNDSVPYRINNKVKEKRAALQSRFNEIEDALPIKLRLPAQEIRLDIEELDEKAHSQERVVSKFSVFKNKNKGQQDAVKLLTTPANESEEKKDGSKSAKASKYGSLN